MSLGRISLRREVFSLDGSNGKSTINLLMYLCMHTYQRLRLGRHLVVFKH